MALRNAPPKWNVKKQGQQAIEEKAKEWGEPKMHSLEWIFGGGAWWGKSQRSSMASRTSVTRGQSQACVLSAGGRTHLPKNFSKIDGHAQPRLGCQLSEVETRHAVLMTINTKAAPESHFWEGEKPAHWARRMLSGRIYKAFIHEKSMCLHH